MHLILALIAYTAIEFICVMLFLGRLPIYPWIGVSGLIPGTPFLGAVIEYLLAPVDHHCEHWLQHLVPYGLLYFVPVAAAFGVPGKDKWLFAISLIAFSGLMLRIAWLAGIRHNEATHV